MTLMFMDGGEKKELARIVGKVREQAQLVGKDKLDSINKVYKV